MSVSTITPIPVLKHGDRLTREEFERRYEAMPELKKAELIDGVVYMPSPVLFENHGEQHSSLVTWVGTYRVYTPGVAAGADSTLILDLDSEPQPDALMFIRFGGNCRLERGYVVDGPEWAGEVAASSASIDMGKKFHLYRRNGVREYLVWRVLDDEIDWFALRGDQYEKLLPDEVGILRSEVFPGLWLDPAALIRGDLMRVHDVLQQGLHSPEHQAFAAEMRKRMP